MNEEIENLESKIQLYLDMIEEINRGNHFEANPEVLVELECEYHRLIDSRQKLKQAL